MKVRIEQDDTVEEPEIVIRCRRTDNEILRCQRTIAQQMEYTRLTLHKDGKVFYLPPEVILFFETEQETVYAHTTKDAFRVRFRLYELEGMLPPTFLRISKSAIVNTERIYTLTHSFTSGAEIQFENTHKRIYVSRRYSTPLRDRLAELWRWPRDS